jgi:hypothetical protein
MQSLRLNLAGCIVAILAPHPLDSFSQCKQGAIYNFPPATKELIPTRDRTLFG